MQNNIKIMYNFKYLGKEPKKNPKQIHLSLIALKNIIENICIFDRLQIWGLKSYLVYQFCI